MISELLSSHTLRIVVPQHLFLFFGIVTIFFGISSPLWLLMIPVGYLILAYIGGAIFVHRYWCHNSFETWVPLARFGAYLGNLCGMGSALAVYVIHMNHHVYTDTEKDPHTPRFKGRLWCWLLWKNDSKLYFKKSKIFRKIPKRLVEDRYIRFMHRHYYMIWWATFLILALISWKFAIFFMAGAGVYYFHIEGFINSHCHDNIKNGYRNGETKDLSINHNSKLMMYLSLGNTLHNNHHLNPNKYSYIVKPGEFDLAHYLVPLISKK
jgi:stearoyl-CoA desaturase (delta-9 desaturase)